MRERKSIPHLVLADFRRTWKRLVATDLVYKAAAFVILTPLSALLLQLFIRLSGRTVLSDQDILFFLLGPIGWLALIVMGAIGVGIIALEMAALMLIGFGAGESRDIAVTVALKAALQRAGDVLVVTARMMGWIVLTVAPFAVAAGVVYLRLLTEHDINYYLTSRPPEYRLALGIAGVLMILLVVLIVRLVSGWFFSVPLLLFEDVPAGEALAESAKRTRGHRLWITRWILVWVATGIALSIVVTGPIALLGRWLVPMVAGSLTLLIPILGLTTGLWGLAHLAVGVVMLCLFALLLVHLYRLRGAAEGAQLPAGVSSDVVGPARSLALSGRRWLWAGLVAVALAVTIGVVVINQVSLEDHTEIAAHRGASAAAPENTMASMLRAIEDETDWVELDVQETADGVVIVGHDSDFMKVANDPTKIWDATYEELQALDIGSWFGPEFAGERVPTLAEVLDACKGRVGVIIELKYYGHDQQLEQRVIDLVEERDMADQVVIMSLKLEGMEKFQQLRPDWTVGLLAAVAVGNLTQADVDFLAVNVELATPLFIRSAHRRGKKVYVWTVDDPIGMSTQFSRGIDRLITDEPALARQVLAQRAELGSVERLLVELAALFGVGSDLELTEADA